MPLKKARRFIGLIPWACSYRMNGATYGITLYATSSEQIERDFADFGEIGVVVEGRLIGTVDWMNNVIRFPSLHDAISKVLPDAETYLIVAVHGDRLHVAQPPGATFGDALELMEYAKDAMRDD